MFITDAPIFKVISSRSADGKPIAPSITVRFANGFKDEMILNEYKLKKESPAACNFLGRLKSSPSSSVAVTGCLDKPGDQMEITLLSEHNRNSMMYSVDFAGNTRIIENPFKYGGL